MSDGDKLKLVLISDTHEQHDKLGKLPDGDVLIHAGDYTYWGDVRAKNKFYNWFFDQPHKNKIYIAGNHDFNEPMRGMLDSYGGHYLYDSSVILDGVKFWGSPYTPRFFNWAFMYDAPTERWNEIPDDTDVLITHGPPYGVNDQPYGTGSCVGCFDLFDRVNDIQPKLHVFGHIHGGAGRTQFGNGTIFVNASVVNEAYEVVNPPTVVEI